MARRKWEELGKCPNCGADLEGCIEGGEPVMRAVNVPPPPVPSGEETPPAPRGFFDRVRGEGK